MRTASSPTSSAIWSAVPFVPGNVHSADGRQDVLQFVVAFIGGKFKRRYFRADAAFANPEVYEFLEAESPVRRAGPQCHGR